LTFLSKVLTKFYPFLFLFLVFGSLILGPLFITDTPQFGFNFISQALAQESSDEESSDSGDDEEKESDDQSEEESDDQSEEESDDQSEEESDDQSEEESDEQKCIETEEIEEETDDQLSEETCDNSETDEESNEESEEESDKEAQETDETDKESDKETQETDEIQKDEASNSGTEVDVPTVLDVILSDDSLLKEVVDDKTTEPGFASALTVIQEEQISLITETCGNQADDDGDGITDENCEESTSTLIETCGNQADDDGDGMIDEEECTVPPTETCGNQADDDGDGMIDEEECTVPPVEVCDNDIDDDADGKIDDTNEDDCPSIMPTVVIESAEDEEGEPLSQGDMIAPGEVTFTFTAETGETSVDSQENSQDLKFECALDGKSFSSCNSPETIKMDDGKHTFEVRLVS
jgi:hypothetical protein